MGWSVTEDLLCVTDDGTVMVYDIHGAIKKTLSMGQVSVKSFCVLKRLKKRHDACMIGKNKKNIKLEAHLSPMMPYRMSVNSLTTPSK